MKFTQQELEAAYKQMEQERADDASFAQLAASQLQQKLGQTNHQFQARPDDRFSALRWGVAITPHPQEYILVAELCQYDNWHGLIQALSSAGVRMQPWNGHYHPGPVGEFDVSQDPAFSSRTIQTYKVRIDYYDSHAGGF